MNPVHCQTLPGVKTAFSQQVGASYEDLVPHVPGVCHHFINTNLAHQADQQPGTSSSYNSILMAATFQ